MKTNQTKTYFRTNKAWYWIVICLLLMSCSPIQSQWKPARAPLITRWTKNISPDNVHQEYPRPQMVRKDWLNLNGLWEYAIRPNDGVKPEIFDGQILVPFPVESALSGLKSAVNEKQHLWYRRTFDIPDNWAQQRILLHFGAVDWETVVWVNGKKVGKHQGGYDPFTFDITDALNKTARQEIVMYVWDPTKRGLQPRGKQVKKPEGIWYTAVTGIWQTVWLEPVPTASVKTLQIAPDIDAGVLKLTVSGRGVNMKSHMAEKFHIRAVALDNGKEVSATNGHIGSTLKLKLNNPKLWSPDNPFLYDLRVTLMQEGRDIDTVTSYFGMRKVSLGKDKKGITRIFLNNRPMFMFGPLDQGFWPDGLYTAPTDQALRYDIEMTKKLGFNMARKHVKVEPQRWYYWCDKMGLMVYQDMPSGDGFVHKGEPDLKRSEWSAKQFELELKRLIDNFANHPSIVMWIAFNEGWGQYDTPRIVNWIKQYDPARLVNNASGWADRGVGDVHAIHSYPGPAAPSNEPNRAAVLGEFGGLALPVKGHLWDDSKSWGYRSYKTREELTAAYLDLVEKLCPLIDRGLSAAVYTQTSDVEIEVNGLMTYDRAMLKMDHDKIAAANRRLYLLLEKQDNK